MTKSLKYSFCKTLVFLTLLIVQVFTTYSQGNDTEAMYEKYEKDGFTSLTSIDKEILPYFPRWTICEPNLIVKIKQIFRLNGFKNISNTSSIKITTTPKPNTTQVDSEDESSIATILLIECGDSKFTYEMVKSKIGDKFKEDILLKNYCYQDEPITAPPTQAQVDAIVNFLEMPTNTTHSFALSAFEQAMKLGKEDGFWIRSVVGTEGAGYTFLSAGEAKVQIHHPLYVNTDNDTKKAIPNLLNFHIGMGYRLQDTSNGALSFLPQRQLNAGYGGKGIFGFDFHNPYAPNFGITFHVEVPMQGIDTLKPIERGTYSAYFKDNPNSPRDQLVVAPLLRITGNTGFFYNWWLDEPNSFENFIRIDLGINYTEVREVEISQRANDGSTYTLNDKTEGLGFYHPTEFKDWLYAKVEYRNQSTFPFGLSAQYSNQIFLGRVYLPLIGNWLYLDARYSIPLRSESRPFERSVFMISPVLRLNI